jgi:hypothetical protein
VASEIQELHSGLFGIDFLRKHGRVSLRDADLSVPLGCPPHPFPQAWGLSSPCFGPQIKPFLLHMLKVLFHALFFSGMRRGVGAFE